MLGCAPVKDAGQKTLWEIWDYLGHCASRAEDFQFRRRARNSPCTLRTQLCQPEFHARSLSPCVDPAATGLINFLF